MRIPLRYQSAQKAAKLRRLPADVDFLQRTRLEPALRFAGTSYSPVRTAMPSCWIAGAMVPDSVPLEAWSRLGSALRSHPCGAVSSARAVSLRSKRYNARYGRQTKRVAQISLHTVMASGTWMALAEMTDGKNSPSDYRKSLDNLESGERTTFAHGGHCPQVFRNDRIVRLNLGRPLRTC